MATALMAGAFSSGVLTPNDVVVVETSAEQREKLKRQFPTIEVFSATDQAAGCSKIVLAVKPQILREIGEELGDALPGDQLWISIVAGVNLWQLSQLLGAERIVRVMPNTPAQIGAGAAALSAAVGASKNDVAWVMKLMQSVGTCVEVAESQLHAVTGIAGSSPAYIYLVIEALADGGVAGGLSRDQALKLSAQAVLGAARMVLETGKHPGQLKDQVTSPGGTTIAALRRLEKAGLRSALIEAVDACIRKSKELEEGP